MKRFARLDVAVDDAVAVRGVERVGDLDTEIEQVVERQRTAREPLLQRLAFEQLHHHELLAVVLADVVQRADVRVAQRRDDPRLAQKALHRLRIAAELRRQQLQRHVTTEPGVFRFVDHAHAAAAERREHTIVRDGLAIRSVAS